MKTINLLACLLLAIILLNSCDTRKDYMDKFNTVPEFGVKKKNSGGAYQSALADTAWFPGLPYMLDYRVKDNANDIEKYNINVLAGIGLLSVDEVGKQMTISGCVLGKNTYELSCTDKYNAKAISNLDLYVVSNRTPKANLFVIQTNSVSPREIKVSGVNSIDLDMPYGDFIAEYQYKIGPSYNSTSSYSVNTPLNSINYIAAATGTVMVYLRVKDSQGALSGVDSLQFNIN